MEFTEHTAMASQTRGEGAYCPIKDYGVIGDCRTATLVGPDGNIDWACLPHFASPALFCRLLDADRGGFFQLAPSTPMATTTNYLASTNVVTTTFTGATGSVRLTDSSASPTAARLGTAPPGVRAGDAASFSGGRARKCRGSQCQ